MALKTPYATVSEANAYLKTNDAWSNLSTSEKNNHLINGRYYIDSNYACSEVDETNISEEYKYANSLLAEIDLATGLFTVDDTVGSPIVEKRVKAGSVESQTLYAGNRSSSLRLNGIDKYPQITSLLSEFCTLKKGSQINSSSLLRA